MDVWNHNDLAERIDILNMQGPAITHREYYMQGINDVESDKRTVWMRETHAVSSTPIRAKNVRKSHVLPYRRSSSLRYSVPGSPGISPVRKSSSFNRDSSTPLRESPVFRMREADPPSQPTRVRHNTSRRADNNEAHQLKAKKDIQRNISKWAPKIYASQRTEQYMPLELLSDDEEGPGINNFAEARMNGCGRKKVIISKATIQPRSSNKGFQSKCDSIDSGKGMSEAISSGMRTVSSGGRGFEEGSMNNGDRERSIDSGLSRGPGKDYYANRNSPVMSSVHNRPRQGRASNLKTAVQESNPVRDDIQRMRKSTMSQFISSINWKTGPNTDYDPLEVVSADEDSDAITNKKRRGARQRKGQRRNGAIKTMETYHNNQENNAGRMGQRGILKKPHRESLPLKSIAVNASIDDYADDEHVRGRMDDEIQYLCERLIQDEEGAKNRGGNIMYSRREDFKSNSRSREVSPADDMSDVSTHSHRLSGDAKEIGQIVCDGENYSELDEDEDGFTEDEIVNDESLCSDVDGDQYHRGRQVYGNKRLNDGVHQSHSQRQKSLREGFGSVVNDPRHFIHPQCLPLNGEASESDLEEDDERFVNVSGPIEYNSHRKSVILHDASFETHYEQGDERLDNTGGPIHEHSFRVHDQCMSPIVKRNLKGKSRASRNGNITKRTISQSSQTDLREVSGNRKSASEKKPRKAPGKKQKSPSNEMDNKDANIKRKRGRPCLADLDKGTVKCTPKNSKVVKKKANSQEPCTESTEVVCSQLVSGDDTATPGVGRKKPVQRAKKSPITSSDDADKKDVGAKRKPLSHPGKKGAKQGKSTPKSNGAEEKKRSETSTTTSSDDTSNKDSGTKRKRGRPRLSPPNESNTKKEKSTAKNLNRNMKKEKQQKSQTESSGDASGQEVSGDGATKRKKRGRPPKSLNKPSCDSGQKSKSSQNDDDKSKSLEGKRKRDSGGSESEGDANIPPKRRSLHNPDETKNVLTMSQKEENSAQKNASSKPLEPNSFTARRKSQGGSSSDYLRKKVLTMRLGNSVFQKSVIEDDENVATSTPVKPPSKRRSSFSSVKESESAHVISGSLEKNDDQVAVNNSQTEKLNGSLGEVLNKNQSNADKIESMPLSPSNPDNSTSKQNPSSTRGNNDPNKANKSIQKLDSRTAKSLNTSHVALIVDEKLLDLPNKGSPVDETQSTSIGRMLSASTRRGSIKTVVDGKEKELALFVEYSRLNFRSRHEGTRQQDDKVRYGAALDVIGLGTGYIHLAPGTEKGLQHPKSYNMVFLILDGIVEVKIHESELLARPGDFFAVPKGCKYNLIGRGDKNSVVAYFKSKAV